MGIFMREIGKTTKQMDMALINIIMVLDMKVNGSMIISMEKEFRLGSMEAVIKASIPKVRKTDKENILGKMEATLSDHGKTIK
jgi:hypothetical protein